MFATRLASCYESMNIRINLATGVGLGKNGLVDFNYKKKTHVKEKQSRDDAVCTWATEGEDISCLIQ